MKALVLQLLFVTAAVGASSETINSPTVKAGDTWTYRVTTHMSTSGWHQTRDETIVSRVTSTSIYYTVKQAILVRTRGQAMGEIRGGVLQQCWSAHRKPYGRTRVVQGRPLI